MKGLFIKDFSLLLQRKQVVIMFLVIGVFMAMMQSATFVIPYLTFLLAIWSLGTLSFDESNHGFAFLMTLPFERKTYVLEKYLFTLLAALIGFAGATILSEVSLLLRGAPLMTGEDFLSAIAGIIAVAICVSFMIPVQLKFGQEKSRIALVVVAAVIGAGAMAFANVAKGAGVDASGVLAQLEAVPAAVLLLAALAAAVILCGISYLISTRIFENKEF